MAKEARAEGYASTNGADMRTSKPVGHMDSLVVLLCEITNEPAELFFGLGFGNASMSSLEMPFMGHYCRMFEPFPSSPATRCLPESGVLGWAFPVVPVAVRGSSRAAI
jgi:hypothetical protein